jgi:hypothetical protein
MVAEVEEAGRPQSRRHRVPKRSTPKSGSVDKMLHRLEFHAMGCEMLAVVDRESACSAANVLMV